MTKILVKLTLMIAALFSTAQAANELRDLFNQAQDTLNIYTDTYTSALRMTISNKTQKVLERDFGPWKLQNDATHGDSFKKTSQAISAAARAPHVQLEHICRVLEISSADFINAIHLMESKMPDLTQQKQIIQAAFENYHMTRI